MRGLVGLRFLLPALGIPACVVALSLGLQAAAFDRPAASSLLAADALRELTRFRVMRGIESTGPRTVRSVCVQGWFRTARRPRLVRGALVLLGDGTRLYDLGHGIRVYGGAPASRTQRLRFLLAGCPRIVDSRLGSQLLHGRPARAVAVHADGTAAYTIGVGETARLLLVVARRTLRPVELTLTAPVGHGSADLEPGGGRQAITQVRRAFGLERSRGRRRA